MGLKWPCGSPVNRVPVCVCLRRAARTCNTICWGEAKPKGVCWKHPELLLGSQRSQRLPALCVLPNGPFWTLWCFQSLLSYPQSFLLWIVRHGLLKGTCTSDCKWTLHLLRRHGDLCCFPALSDPKAKGSCCLLCIWGSASGWVSNALPPRREHLLLSPWEDKMRCTLSRWWHWLGISNLCVHRGSRGHWASPAVSSGCFSACVTSGNFPFGWHSQCARHAWLPPVSWI